MPDVGRLLKLRIWHEKRHPFAGWHLAKVRPTSVYLICQFKPSPLTFLSTGLITKLEFILQLKRR